MKFKIEDDYTVNIFGKQFNSIQHMVIIFGYLLFLIVPWPLISGSYFFIPVGIALVPLILPEFIYEIYKSKKLYKRLMYGSILILTFIYTSFFLDCSFFVSILHFIVYSVFGYISSAKI